MVKPVKINLFEIKNECEASGISSNNLWTCSDIAKFGHCVLVKIRQIIADPNPLPNLNKDGDGDENGDGDADLEEYQNFKIIIQKE